MSSDRNSPPLPSLPTDRRRASITGQTFQDLFSRNASCGGPSTTSAYPGPITSAAAQAQRRRLSLTTIGLSGSPNQTSPFSAVRPRTESISSANSGSVDESPFEDDPAPSASSNPATPFARRLSFGARALRDVRTSNGNIGNSNGRPSVDKTLSPPIAKGRGLSLSTSSTFPFPLPIRARHASTPASDSEPVSLASRSFSHVHPHATATRSENQPAHNLDAHELTILLFHTGEGYNFAENLRSRAERSSIVGAHQGVPSPPAPGQQHHRAKSVSVMEPPARDIPKQAKVPDAFQERILKGDFYMD
ncbi:hypothetical protein K432DRAFT_207363 [Lepidopterella palustris CBS 459.81]|uniref:Uncharacterized protein n=1 Tax=Lepidopterella palustris CBS 459.81 TaxID=1314670 RepID=A0A8E2JHP0_9PEZI|nr:hypothetical protein K432DRAFT_207363 [Lepidopterella palustris CBS 459.81]